MFSMRPSPRPRNCGCVKSTLPSGTKHPTYTVVCSKIQIQMMVPKRDPHDTAKTRLNPQGGGTVDRECLYKYHMTPHTLSLVQRCTRPLWGRFPNRIGRPGPTTPGRTLAPRGAPGRSIHSPVSVHGFHRCHKRGPGIRYGTIRYVCHGARGGRGVAGGCISLASVCSIPISQHSSTHHRLNCERG